MDRKLKRFRAWIIVLALLLAVAGEGCSLAKKIEPVNSATSSVSATQENRTGGVNDQYIARTKEMNATLRSKVEKQNAAVKDGKLNISVVTLDDRYLPALADQLTRYGRDVAKKNSLSCGTFEIAIPNGGISWKSTAADWQRGQFNNVRANYHVSYSISQLYGHYGGIGRGLVR